MERQGGARGVEATTLNICGGSEIADRRWLRFLALSGLKAIGAVALVVTFVARAAPTPDAVRRRMYEDLRANRLARCSEALTWLSRHGPLISEDWMVRARLDHLQGRPDEALACLERVADRDPLGAQARLMSGTIWLGRARARPAEAALIRAVELDPGQHAARLELIQLYSRQQRFAELEAQFQYLADRDLLDFDYLRYWFMARNVPWDAKDDIDTLQRLVAADPDDHRSRLALSEGLRRLGRHEEAATILEMVQDSAPGLLAARARLAIDRGELDRAEALLSRDGQGDGVVAQLRGSLALKREDVRAAVRWFRKAYESDPDDRVALSGLATALRLVGRESEAGPLLDRIRVVAELPPLINRISSPDAAKDSDLHRRLGAISESLGRRSEARAWYHRVIARNPLDAEAQQAVFRLKAPVRAR
jgi:tetratricopeptide (TPR) repeat protein